MRSARIVALLAVLAGVRPMRAQDIALTYDVPAGWSRSLNAQNGLTTLVPPGLTRGRVAVVTIFSPEPFGGSPLDFHNEIIRRVVQNVRLLAPAQHGSNGGFLATTFRGVTPQGIQLWFAIYTARWGDRGQAIIFNANAEDVALAYGPTAAALVQRIIVPQTVASQGTGQGPKTRQTGSTTPAGSCRSDGLTMCPRPIPSGDRSVELAGAYIATAASTSYSVSGGVASRVGTTILVLYKNGVAVRTAAMKNGSLDDTYWAEGIATIDPTNLSDVAARRSGHWSEADGKVRIDWAIGQPQVFTRDGNSLKETYTTWAPYASVDGLRFEGRFARIIEIPPPYILTLHKDGTFTADGVNNTMGGTMVMPYFPEHGSGTYEIIRWSLVLHFTTGYVQSINFMLGQGDRSSPRDFVLNGYDFVRQ